jgi:L-ornithine N5-oxygenase
MASGQDPERLSPEPYDIIGIGFGPSNLALAVAARELAPEKSCLFLERSPHFSWHPGMMLEGSRMQISFLKDLVSLRNLASPYSFLNYLKHRGRLERFINLNEFHPSRSEYYDYLKWVAADFAEMVSYGAEVVSVTRSGRSLFAVECRDPATGELNSVRARNVVVAPGGQPTVPSGVNPAAVIHSSEFLPQFAERLPDVSGAHRVVLVGDGQSAGEIAMFILTHCPSTELHLVIPGYALRPTDNSAFVNEQYFSASSERFFRQPPARRAKQLADLRNSNYGAVEETLLDGIYRLAYLDEVAGRTRLFTHPYSRLISAESEGAGTVVTIEDRFDQATRTLHCDVAVLATGYERQLDKAVFEDVLPYAELDGAGNLALTENHRVRVSPDVEAGLYVQGLGEGSFGLGDTLLSLLPFRSQQIVEDISSRRDRAARHETAQVGGAALAYPPARHMEHDTEKLYAVMEHFKFATLVSARGEDDPVITQVPLILDRSRGRKGVLFGHFDRENPHAALLDDRPITVLFNGPNSYISPTVYETDQLPTWNSITVRVEGRAQAIRERERIVEGLCAISAKSEKSLYPPTLEPDDERIEKLIEYIVGFEIDIIDIVGRFKLSQDREDADRRRAADLLADSVTADHREFIGHLIGLSPEAGYDRQGLTNKGTAHMLTGGDSNGKPE